MDLSVRDASARLGIGEWRVRALVRDGRLRAQRVGRSWLIAEEDVARLSGQESVRGRPLAAARAWGLLDLLSGGRAPWLSPSARSQVRSLGRVLGPSSPDRLRAALLRRQDNRLCRAHPAAIERLSEAALVAGDGAAVEQGVDLVSSSPLPEFYLPAEEWPDLSARLQIRSGVRDPNLVVRLPHAVWPFADGSVGMAALAANLLESGDPRAVEAGMRALRSLAGELGWT